MNSQCSILFINIVCLLILKEFVDLNDEEVGRYLRDHNNWEKDSKLNQVIIEYRDKIMTTLACYFWLRDYKDELLYPNILFQPKYLSCVQSAKIMFDTVISKISPNTIYSMFVYNNIPQTRENALLCIRKMMDQVPESNYEIKDPLVRIIRAIEEYAC